MTNYREIDFVKGTKTNFTCFLIKFYVTVSDFLLAYWLFSCDLNLEQEKYILH